MARAPQPDTLLERARRAFHSMQFAESVRCARQVLERNPRDAEAARVLGTSLVMSAAFVLQEHPDSEIHRQQLKNGFGELDRALELAPNDVESLMVMGAILALQEQWNESADYYGRAAERDPLDPAKRGGLISALCAAGRIPEADEQVTAYFEHGLGPELQILPTIARVGAEEYQLAFTPITVTVADGKYVCENDDIRVYGFGDTFAEALAEWSHVFHLNYTEFALSEEPLSDSGEEYAAQLRQAVSP